LKEGPFPTARPAYSGAMNLVLYSAHYGSKEPLNREVFGPFTHLRRVLFTDRTDVDFPGVEIVQDSLDGLDPARASRRAKLMPHRYLREDWSLWLDNKSRLKRDPLEILDLATSGASAAFFAFPHFRRDCVYHELQTCWENGLDDFRILKERQRTYRAEGMPAHSGLIEGHFILRRHHDPAVAHFGERWFEHVLRYSRRDQISFPYLVWKLGLPFAFIRALDWRETVEHDFVDRANRVPDFPRKHLAYQAARRLYHRFRAG
jgi:hypothetical protein